MKSVLIGALALFLFAGFGVAQQVTSNNAVIVTATVGDAHCVFVGPIVEDLGSINCYGGKTLVFSQRERPALDGPIIGQYKFPLHLISWVLTQPSLGVFQWAITVDGVTSTGTF